MKRTFLAGMAALATLLTAAQSPAAVLFARSLTVDRSVNIFSTSDFSLNFDLADSYFADTSLVALFSVPNLTPTSPLPKRIAKKGNPTFDAFVDRLFDENNEYIRLILTESSSGRAEKRGWQENGFFAGLDLAGAHVESAEFTVESFALTAAPASGIAAAAASPPVDLKVSFKLIGTIPEPATGVAVLCGLAALGAGRRPTRRRGAGDHHGDLK